MLFLTAVFLALGSVSIRLAMVGAGVEDVSLISVGVEKVALVSVVKA